MVARVVGADACIAATWRLPAGRLGARPPGAPDRPRDDAGRARLDRRSGRREQRRLAAAAPTLSRRLARAPGRRHHAFERAKEFSGLTIARAAPAGAARRGWNQSNE